MPFLLIFTLFALLDFVILFSVGSQIGLLTTLLLVLATGFIGLHLIRREGAATFARARERLERGEVPSGELLTGAALIFGGAPADGPGLRLRRPGLSVPDPRCPTPDGQAAGVAGHSHPGLSCPQRGLYQRLR